MAAAGAVAMGRLATAISAAEVQVKASSKQFFDRFFLAIFKNVWTCASGTLFLPWNQVALILGKSGQPFFGTLYFKLGLF